MEEEESDIIPNDESDITLVTQVSNITAPDINDKNF
jgi:hypothetical protein